MKERIYVVESKLVGRIRTLWILNKWGKSPIDMAQNTEQWTLQWISSSIKLVNLHKHSCESHKSWIVNLMSVCPCIVDDKKKVIQLDATQWFYWTYNSLIMYRTLLFPSLGAWDYTDVYSMWHITFVIAGRGSDAWLYLMRPGWAMLLEQHPTTRTQL